VRFIYDGEGGDLFGRSRFENCKDDIQIKREIKSKLRTDLNTSIGNTMIVTFPMGETAEETEGNQRKAATIGVMTSQGQTITVPGFSLQDQINFITNKVDPTKIAPYGIRRLETNPTAMPGFRVAVDLVNEEILFGLLVLPRAVREADHGAKADAEQHTSTTALLAQGWLSYVAGLANEKTAIVLEQNYGPKMRDAVRIKAAPLDDESIGILRKILELLVAGDSSLAMKMIDIRAMLSKLKVKERPGFDQDAILQEQAATSAADDLSTRERLRAKGYDENRIKAILEEKRSEDVVPQDPDGLGSSS
jgi:hypothetical protein